MFHDKKTASNPAPIAPAKRFDISARAMTVKLSLGAWTAKAIDTKVTHKAISDHNAKTGTGKFTKALVESEALDRVNQTIRKARKAHDAMTLPWDAGVRIMPVQMRQKYIQTMADLKAEFETGVRDFIADYRDTVDAAFSNLGDMFRQSDYPEAAMIERKFKWKSKFGIVANPETDFRVSMSDDLADQMRAEMSDDLQTDLTDAMGAAWTRLHDAVKRMVERLDAAGGVNAAGKRSPLHSTVLDNIKELVEILPMLNITGDAILDDMVNRCRDSLCTFDIETLKSDPDARDMIKAEAQTIADDMAIFMGA